MRSLELKVPPPIVAAVAAGGMGALARWTPVIALPAGLRGTLAALLVAAGLAIALAGVREFRRARTTVHPLRPERASALVDGGIYRITRNPMYLGMLAVLLGWAAWLAAPWALLGPAAFVAFIGRFQIAPEERALRQLFGAAYAAYTQRVRRRAPRARTVELNLEATGNQPLFHEHIYGPATEVVPRYIERVLAGRWQY